MEVIFEQPLMASKVTKDEDGYHIEFSILGGPNTKFTFSDELEAKAAYQVLQERYLVSLRLVQRALIQSHDDSETFLNGKLDNLDTTEHTESHKPGT